MNDTTLASDASLRSGTRIHELAVPTVPHASGAYIESVIGTPGTCARTPQFGSASR